MRLPYEARQAGLTTSFLAPSATGRTGRFGRKGISINFVHDKSTWQQMEQIERATGKQIIRIETNDLDAMEEVRVCLCALAGESRSQI